MILAQTNLEECYRVQKTLLAFNEHTLDGCVSMLSVVAIDTVEKLSMSFKYTATQCFCVATTANLHGS